MMRCPDQYCCETQEQCTDINSCNSGRVGVLCGRCAEEMTESLFSAQCFPVHQCSSLLFGLLYALCVAVYAIFLATYQDVKKFVIDISSRLILRLKTLRKSERHSSLSEENKKIGRKDSVWRRLSLLDHSERETATRKNTTTRAGVRKWKSLEILTRPNKDSVTEEKQEETEEEDDPESNMKYMQILLCYVQDASLFKIHLPDSQEDTDNFVVQFLRFSPEILSIYYRMAEWNDCDHQSFARLSVRTLHHCGSPRRSHRSVASSTQPLSFFAWSKAHPSLSADCSVFLSEADQGHLLFVAVRACQ